MADPIEHVIVLMLENHSFDQLLGSLQGAVFADLDGVDRKNFKSNVDPQTGKPVIQTETTETAIQLDPPHEFVDVARQLADQNGGFVAAYVHAHPGCTADEKQQVMSYYPVDFLPVLHKLARNFTVCDRWFSSMPGPTWPNRFFVHSGTCKGHVKMPSGVFDRNWHCYDQRTIYDELCDHDVSWKIYHQGEAQTLVMVHQLLHATHYHDMESFFDDTQDATEFPQYVFIEPCYSGTAQNDQHPPTDIMRGELLIARVYNAIRTNEDLWRSTLLILVWDEHGGFYDHAIPPATVAPDGYADEYAFNQLGIRVPALLISPWVDPGVLHTTLDHTSILKYLTDKWGLTPLGARTASANTFTDLLSKRNAPRTDALGTFTDALLGPTEQPVKRVNEHQKALISFSQYLEKKMADVEDMAAVGSRAIKLIDGPRAQFAVAKDRFERFLQHAKDQRIPPDTLKRG